MIFQKIILSGHSAPLEQAIKRQQSEDSIS